MRNRLKRRLRELSRLRLLTVAIAADIVIRIRPNAYGISFQELRLEMDGVIAQLVRWSASVQPTAERHQNSRHDATPGDT
jgi:ribonuclease P protein component